MSDAKEKAATTHGRGAWSKAGMPTNATSGFYELLAPVLVGSEPQQDQSHRAVNYGVRAIQVYVNQLYALVKLPTRHVNGIYDHATENGVRLAQYVAGIGTDGVFGPKTAAAFFWPTIKTYVGLTHASWAPLIGGIAHLESGFDPGAVGYVINNDLGLAQINLPANPSVSEAQAFDPHFALHYLVNRMTNAFSTFTNQDAAIVSYNNPAWAREWEKSGKAPTAAAQEYVNLVRAWKAP